MKKSILLFFVSILIIYTTIAQSGWVREKKDYFVKADYTFYNATKYHNLFGNTIITNKFSQKTVTFYGEYGVGKNFAINTTLPLLRQNGYENTKKVTGIGDVKIEFKYALKKGKFPIAISIAPELPIGTQTLLAKSKTNSAEVINLPSGDGEINIWTTIAASHSFYPKPIYVSAYTSFNYRTSYKERDFQHQMQTGIEAGYKVKNKLWLNTKLLVLSGVGKKPQFADFIRGDGTTYTAFTLGGMYEIGKHWGITSQYFRCNSLITKARNNYVAGILSLGVAYNKKR
jgi:hypothetical protein